MKERKKEREERERERERGCLHLDHCPFSLGLLVNTPPASLPGQPEPKDLSPDEKKKMRRTKKQKSCSLLRTEGRFEGRDSTW